MLNWLKTHKLWTLLIFAGLIFGAYRYYSSKQVEYLEHQVTRTSLRDTLELSGKVASGRSASLRFLAGGLVTYIGPKAGDEVKQWQTLASIDSRQLQKVMEQKLNLYAIQRTTFDQTVDDNDNSIPGGELGETLKRILAKNQYQLENAVKDVEYQDLTLKLSRLSSPISGILIHAPIDTANVQVAPTDAWVVVDPDSLYFSADLDETDLARVKLGQKVIITLDAFPDQEFESSIEHISYSPKETSVGTTYELKLSLPQDQLSSLRLGLNGTSAIILSEKDAVLSLPSSALSVKDGRYFVTVKNGSKYEERAIETGIENGGIVEIVSGLGDQDYVYTKK